VITLSVSFLLNLDHWMWLYRTSQFYHAVIYQVGFSSIVSLLSFLLSFLSFLSSFLLLFNSAYSAWNYLPINLGLIFW
jgi:hypothetical protein